VRALTPAASSELQMQRRKVLSDFKWKSLDKHVAFWASVIHVNGKA
jgi:hypothetical protein